MKPVDRRQFLVQSASSVPILGFALSPDLFAIPYRCPEPMKVAVLGAGTWGREILTELARFENVQVVAVADSDPGRLRRGVRMTREATAYSGWRDLLDQQANIFAAFIALPTHLHKDPALACLGQGIHTYCEAPLASTREDAEAMVRASRTAGRTFAVGHLGRSNPVYKLARSFYRSGSIETLISLKAWWHRKNSWRVTVSNAAREHALNWRLNPDVSLGLLGESCSHQLDTLFWYTDLLPLSTHAKGSTIVHQDGRKEADTIVAEYGMKGGVRLSIDATLGNSYEGSHELLVGSMGSIKLAERFGWLFKEADAPIQGWEVYANRQQFHDEQGITLIADATKLASQGKLKEGIGLPFTPLYYGLEAFLKATAGEPVACTADQAFQTLVATLAGRRAQISGDKVDIPEESYRVD
jgi:predicted dehydrogenase